MLNGVTGLNHITLAVCSIQRSFDFYTEVLGFVPVALWSRGAYLSAGDIWLALVADDERRSTPSSDYSHIAFSCCADDFDDLKMRIKDANSVAWSENRSEGASWYFLDPDGHKLEVHVGDLQSRLVSMRTHPWEDIKFYDANNGQES